jgi:hypothetical protein
MTFTLFPVRPTKTNEDTNITQLTLKRGACGESVVQWEAVACGFFVCGWSTVDGGVVGRSKTYAGPRAIAVAPLTNRTL